MAPRGETAMKTIGSLRCLSLVMTLTRERRALDRAEVRIRVAP